MDDEKVSAPFDELYALRQQLDQLKRTQAERQCIEEALREREDKLQEILNNAAVMVGVTDSRGRWMQVNRYATEMLGYSLEELYQKSHLEVTHPDDVPKSREQFERLLRGEIDRYQLEKRYLCKDGSVLWGMLSASPIWNKCGEVEAVIGVITDVTVHKQTETALQRRNHELALLNRVGQELNTSFDQQQVTAQLLRTVVEMIDAKGASLWLWDATRVGGLTCQAFYHLDQNELLPLDLHLAPGQGVAGWVARHGTSTIIPDVYQDARFLAEIDAQTGFRTASLAAVPLWVRGKIIGVLEVVNKCQAGCLADFDADDLSLIETLAVSAAVAIDNARLIKALRQYTAELETQNDELDAYAHTVAHDLQNPLALVVGFADVLQAEEALKHDQVLQERLSIISRNARKMNNIIDELLLLSSVRKQEQVPLAPLDIVRIIGEARERLTDLIKEQQAQIILPPGWPAALGYSPWVEEVWVNYMSNAIKYGGHPPRLELGAEVQGDDMVRFWVQDNGGGLSDEEQTRLFIPFERLGHVRAQGHGLGLSIVRRIVEKLGGQVGVQSQLGQGSKFWFTLPRATK